MERFKFKAWNRIVKRMSNSTTIKELNVLGTTVQWHNLEIMQFTGLKDCFKTEIFESDIVQFEYTYDIYKNIKLIGVFSYNENDLEWEIDIYKNDRYVCLKYQSNGLMDKFKVLGNIHENKELIK